MLLFTLLTKTENERISQLIPSVAGGNEDALTALYNMVGGRLLSVAMGITRNLTLAEDVVSDGFVKAVNFSHQFKGGNGYGWLCTIIRNTALNAIKKEKRLQGDNIDDIFNLTDGKDLASHSAVALDVENALKKLEKSERTCIWLKYFNDYTVREIAVETGIAKSSVQDIIKKAEKKLKEYLE